MAAAQPRAPPHAGPHVLIEQTDVALQGMPHAPQCALSLAIDTHWPKQSVCPTAQLSAHPPPTQRCPGAHIIPQPPQLKTSVLVSTQPGPHIVVPPGQPVAHVPPWHSPPNGHGMPQPPQFIGSKRGSTQPGPHASSGGAQPELMGTHVASTQPPTAQSRLRVQAAPSGQGAHEGPPQSTSLSRPFASWSVQLAAAHAPPVQTPLSQSVPITQRWPSAQASQPPPQSTSVSAPDTFASRQLPGAQARFTQSTLWQSSCVTQVRPISQAAQAGPPQSTALSVPFFAPSVQVGAGEVQPAVTSSNSRGPRNLSLRSGERSAAGRVRGAFRVRPLTPTLSPLAQGEGDLSTSRM